MYREESIQTTSIVYTYLAPSVEVIEIEVEHGFAATTGTQGTGGDMPWG